MTSFTVVRCATMHVMGNKHDLFTSIDAGNTKHTDSVSECRYEIPIILFSRTTNQCYSSIYFFPPNVIMISEKSNLASN